MTQSIMRRCLIFWVLVHQTSSFVMSPVITSFSSLIPNRIYSQPDDRRGLEGPEEYKNVFTKIASAFLKKQVNSEVTTFDSINWKANKKKQMNRTRMISELKKLLPKNEWFVTGKVEPGLFSDSFKFQDPDVKVAGIESYARGVRKIFNQKSSRAKILSIEEGTKENMITVTWRLSGGVNIFNGLEIKPYIVYTDYLLSDGLDDKGLIVFQEDRFSIPGWDILLSALFPILRPLLSAPAPDS